ncbi:NAD(P)-binding protein [Poronia punctata]|nr:NAD(P)-binding protein [Poronia punctata]
MKLIVTGATGFIGQEVIRQSLSRPEITSIIALSRKPIPIPITLTTNDDDDDKNNDRLKNLLVEDYLNYSDDVKKEFADADACIWTVAITPMDAKNYTPEQVKQVCQESPLAGLRAIHQAGPARARARARARAKPFRFLYMSGSAAERDQSKKPKIMAEYMLMRGCSSCGLIIGLYVWILTGHRSIDVGVLAAVMVEQVITGFEKEEDPLMSGDLIRIGKGVKVV